MDYLDLQDRIQYLTYRSTEPDFTPEEEAELVRLLEEREACPEYQREQARKRFFLSLM
jgi:hypothetical protein